MYDPYVTIPDPTGHPDDMPIFDGYAWDARDRLIPGAYRGTWDATDLDAESDRPGWLIVWDKSVVGKFVIDHPADRGAVWDDDEFPAIMDYMRATTD